MTEEKSLKDTIEELIGKIDNLSKDKKTKSWNLPFTAKMGMGKKKKRQGYILFVHIGENKAITFIKAPIEDGVAMVNGIPHHIRPEDILIWKNKIPMVIQPQWSELPFSPRTHYEKTLENNENSMGWKYIINYMNKTQIENKKKVSGGLIIVGVIILLGLGYYLIKSGALS